MVEGFVALSELQQGFVALGPLLGRGGLFFLGESGLETSDGVVALLQLGFEMLMLLMGVWRRRVVVGSFFEKARELCDFGNEGCFRALEILTLRSEQCKCAN